MLSRVLLITPQFYGIEKKIKSVLEKLGYEVKWIENKTLMFDYHGTRSKFKLLRKLYFLLFSPQKKYLKSEFRKIGGYKADILFAINAHVINYQLLRKLKGENPALVSILYLWDSSRMYNWGKEIKWFDKVFTFEPDDAIKYDIDYKPNFFVKNIATQSAIHDLFFVGKYSLERKLLIDEIINQAEENITYFVKLLPGYKIFPHNHLIYKIFKILKFKYIWIKKYLANYEAVEGITESNFLTKTGVTYDNMQVQLASSNVILDIPFEPQNGYTHRLIEALAYGKKVLTTNSKILKEDFYNPDQIHILDPHSPRIECSWMRTKSIFAVHKYFDDLELSVWLKSILNAPIAKDKN